MSNKTVYTKVALFSIIFIVCACTQVDPTQISTGSPTEIIETTTPSLATETPTILPAATDPYNEGPAQIAISNEITAIEIITTPFTFNEVAGTRYQLSQPGLLLGVLPDNQILIRSENNSISIVDLTHSTTRKLVENVRFPVEVAPTAQRIIVPLPSETGQYPIWSIGFQGESPKLLGTTSGYFPFYSTTDDGKVLLIENGHLILKWYEDEQLKSQPLEQLEEMLNLQWHTYDLTKGPDESRWETPWIDFSISPRGKWLAVFDGQARKFWLISVDGTIVKEIPIDPQVPEYQSDLGEGPQIKFHRWSPDEKYLIYQESVWGRMGNSAYQQLKIASPEEDYPTLSLTTAEQSIAGDASWSPDGKLVAYSAQSWDSFHSGDPREAHLFLAGFQNGSIDNANAIFDAYRLYVGSFWQNEGHVLFFNCWDTSTEDFKTNICAFNANQ